MCTGKHARVPWACRACAAAGVCTHLGGWQGFVCTGKRVCTCKRVGAVSVSEQDLLGPTRLCEQLPARLRCRSLWGATKPEQHMGSASTLDTDCPAQATRAMSDACPGGK